MPPAVERGDHLPLLRSALAQLWPGVEPGDVVITPLRAQASTRRYYRLSAPDCDPASAVAMQLPDAELPVQEDEHPFLNVQRHLAQGGVRVPEVFGHDLRHGIILLEDLGDETFEARLERTELGNWQALYRHAVDTLLGFHAACQGPPESCVAYGRAFDQRQLRWELDHFTEWGLEALGHVASPVQRPRLDALFEELVEQLVALPQRLCHRDYQSRNLMWVGDELVVIDFQDALMGPAPFDLMALLCDSYVSLPASLQDAMVAHYIRGAGLTGEDARGFERGFWLTAIQRKLKDAGRFVYMDQVRGDARFLPYFAPSLRYVGRALTRTGQVALDALLRDLLPGFPKDVAQPSAQTGLHAAHTAPSR